MKAIVVIPARYQSTRLPGKPLKLIGKKPMIQHVYERAKKSKMVSEVVVATDDKRIVEIVEEFGGVAFMTSTNHKSGTDRVIEISSKIRADYYINVQGDEPFINPKDIDKLITNLKTRKSDEIATLCYRSTYIEAKQNNKVKVVFDFKQKALYFSRSLIPYSSNPKKLDYYIHIGMYGYGKKALQQLQSLTPSNLEIAEKLEQLRFLQSGLDIYIDITEKSGISVDTNECLEDARFYLKYGKLPDDEIDLTKVKLVVLDVDGVLSPSSLMLSENGEEIKIFDVRDGLGIKRLLQAGIKVAVISGRGSKTTARRLEELGIKEFYFNIEEKDKTLDLVMKRHAVMKKEVIYVGDDLNDLPAFEIAGISCTVKDAPKQIKSRADIILSKKGGKGAIRELSDRILT